MVKMFKKLKKKNNIWCLLAKNRVPLPCSCCLELWGLFTSDVGVSLLLLLLRGNAHVVVYSHMMNMSCRVLDADVHYLIS